MSVPQALVLYGLVQELKPDIIVELGRGAGNSTAVFCQAVNDAGRGKVASFCLSDHWQRVTQPTLREIVPAESFQNLQIFTQDLTRYDFGPLLDSATTVLVFWDAHGFDIAESVLGHLLPKISSKRHMVLCHDISDGRFSSPEARFYGGKRPWRGMDAFYENPGEFGYLWTDWAVTIVDQALPLFDFCRRNLIELHSVDRELRQDAARAEALLGRLPLPANSTFALSWFDLAEAPAELTFPPDPLCRVVNKDDGPLD